MDKNKQKAIIMAVVMIASFIAIFILGSSNLKYKGLYQEELKKECTYETKSECLNSDDGYLKTYDWIDGWSKNCQKEGKIFTVESTEKGTIINPRCALEKKVN